MTKKTPEKCNESCIKMFEFLKNLYQGEVDFDWTINHFSDGQYDGTSNTHVTLNKYLNALKIFGVKVKKINGKYHLQSPYYKIKFDLNDIKSIHALKKAIMALPNGKNKTNCEKFIAELEKRFDETSQNLAQIEANNQSEDMEFYHAEMLKQIRMCEQYCQDNQKLEITFTDDKDNEINLLASPLETVYLKRRICLKVLGTNGSRVYEIPIDNIKSIKQLPTSANKNSMPTTIVYRIKNRLAKNYRLRDWEKLQTIEPDGSHVIVNKDEDFDVFLHRVMRYGKECSIISPKFIKDEMIDLINKTLSNYQ